MTHEFVLEGLTCANCAAKIEEKLNHTDDFSDVSFSFATKSLSLNSELKHPRDKIQQIVDSVEDGVTVKEADEEEEEESSSSLKIILLIAGAALFLAALLTKLVFHNEILIAIFSVLAVLLSGWDVLIDGVKSAFKLRIDETTLMTVAVVAAIALGDFIEAAAVTVLFALGELLEDKAVEKSRRDIRRLADIRPDEATLLENGVARKVKAEQVKIGSLIEIAPHRRVPLDGVIVEGTSTVDASSLTGESLPMTVGVGDELLSSMMNHDNTVVMKTTKSYSDSAASRILKMVEDSTKNKGNREKLITRFSRVYTPVVIGIAVLIAIVPPLFLGDFAMWLKRALVCLVASCPCAIVISVPLSYFAGIGAASKRGILIKGGRFIEALATVKHFAFDKTGTLTDQNISLKEIKSTGYYSEKELLKIAASLETQSDHPIAGAVKDAAEKQNISLIELKDHQEHAGSGVSARLGKDRFSFSKNETGEGIALKKNDQLIGSFFFSEHIREEAPPTLRTLRALGVKSLVMLTGDKADHAKSVADTLKLDQVFSELLPEEKVEKIETLTDNGGCAFVGDGINDAPVLAASSCGIAMGLGSEAAIEAADMVVAADSLSPLPTAVKISRATVSTVKRNITFSLLVKLAIIILAVFGLAPMWLAVFADTGVCVLCVLYATRLIKKKHF